MCLFCERDMRASFTSVGEAMREVFGLDMVFNIGLGDVTEARAHRAVVEAGLQPRHVHVQLIWARQGQL